jgi:hypothetical protein
MPPSVTSCAECNGAAWCCGVMVLHEAGDGFGKLGHAERILIRAAR